MASTDEMWLNWEEVNQRVRGKRVIFFGRGEWMEKALNYLVSGGDYVVDNNKYEQGQTESGLCIYSPQKLRTEERDDIFVLITTKAFQEVEAQLCSIGLVPGQHFCVSPSLRSLRAIARVNDHDQTVFFTCSARYMDGIWHKGGGFYSLSLQSGKTRKLVNGLCHGITEGEDCTYLVDDTVGIRVLTSNWFLERERFQLPPKSRPHGIAYCPKRDLIFVAFSGRDSIGVYEADGYKLVDEMFLSGKWARTGIAQHHVNDLCVHNDSLYVSMFSVSGNWKIGMFDGVILEFDLEEPKIIPPVATNLWLPHSPTMINGILCYTDSMRGKVYVGSQKVMTQFNGFVRGIAYDGEFYYVGQSMHRYVNRRLGTTNNISLDTGIFMVDAVSKMTKFFATPHLTDINALFIPSWGRK